MQKFNPSYNLNKQHNDTVFGYCNIFATVRSAVFIRS